MTVKKLIEILNKCVDPDLAEIEFWIGDQYHELERVGQFGIIPTVTFTLKATELPLITPIKHFRRDKVKIIKKKEKEIKKSLKKK